jgi:GNAT superfamily N-acetyltransferase
MIGMRSTDPPTVSCIRPAEIEEAAALSDLCFRSKRVWGYDDAFMGLARAALQVPPAQIEAGDVWVATAPDGSLAGVLVLASAEQPATIDLDKLFIEPRQMRAGFGRVLLTYAVAEARRRGANRITILADPYAAPFYERHGARLIGEAPSDAIPGHFLPLYEIAL